MNDLDRIERKQILAKLEDARTALRQARSTGEDAGLWPSDAQGFQRAIRKALTALEDALAAS